MQCDCTLSYKFVNMGDVALTEQCHLARLAAVIYCIVQWDSVQKH